MIDLDDVLAHAHDNCAVCEGTGVVRCWSPGGPCPDGQTVCESCGPCQQSDVPALAAALREARAEVDRLRETMALAESVFMAEARASGQYEAERDDWRRRYEALRDGVTSLCDEATALPADDALYALVYADELRAVVARVEESDTERKPPPGPPASPLSFCPKCRHARHDHLGFCPNWGSDNDCSCTYGVARVEGDES